MPRFCLVLSALVSLSIVVSAQNPPQSDPQGLAYAAQSIAAMTGGKSISDVTLTGNVTWTNSESGSATLKGSGTGESRIDLAITTGARTEIRDAHTGIAIGQWTNPDGTSGLFSYHSCQTDAVWFFPALGSLSAGPNIVLSYIGQETRNSESVQHIRSYVYEVAANAVAVSTQQFSTMDFYLDATTLLPVATLFNTYPDNGSAIALGVEVDFSNYQNIGGVVVPMHIQRSLQGNLLLTRAQVPIMNTIIASAGIKCTYFGEVNRMSEDRSALKSSA
jgi:hypothetical protein